MKTLLNRIGIFQAAEDSSYSCGGISRVCCPETIASEQPFVASSDNNSPLPWQVPQLVGAAVANMVHRHWWSMI